ncbi:hypothetical protein YQE_10147, partial [Dendroctonus ponderosae]
MSLLSVSSESLDQLVSRERYLQSTFESMSGVETEHQTPSNKSSFSSKFITNSSSRNLEAIKAVKQTKSDPEVAKKRQELNKRIAETKKKLESVGHSSPLRYSQSIHNLSNIAVKDKRADRQGKPRKLKLDKTLSKFKMHKSLPVSPVSEERQFADFVEMKKSEELPQRQSFSHPCIEFYNK